MAASAGSFGSIRNYGNTAKYQDAVRRGNVYQACNTGVIALSVNSATATGLIMSNPLTSGFMMVLLRLAVALASPPAAQANLVLTGTHLTTAEANTTHTTPITPKNLALGSGTTAACKVDSAATVPTPAAIWSIPGGPVAASSIMPACIDIPIDGMIVLRPGCCISLQAITTAISVCASVAWEEVPSANW